MPVLDPLGSPIQGCVTIYAHSVASHGNLVQHLPRVDVLARTFLGAAEAGGLPETQLVASPFQVKLAPESSRHLDDASLPPADVLLTRCVRCCFYFCVHGRHMLPLRWRPMEFFPSLRVHNGDVGYTLSPESLSTQRRVEKCQFPLDSKKPYLLDRELNIFLQ